MRRWFRFSTVGLTGLAVQLSALALLARGGVDYRLATALAVEIALLNNFAWHELWTWRGAAIQHRTERFVRFHLSNGLLSIVAGTLLTWAFKQYWGMPLLVANLLAVSLTALLNFALAELWVRRAE